MNDKHKEIQHLFDRYKEGFGSIKNSINKIDYPTSNITNARDIFGDFLAISHILYLLAKDKNDPENIYEKLYNNFKDNTMKGIKDILEAIDTSPNAEFIKALKHKIEELQTYIVDQPNGIAPNILDKDPDALKGMLRKAIDNATTSFNILEPNISQGTKLR